MGRILFAALGLVVCTAVQADALFDERSLARHWEWAPVRDDLVEPAAGSTAPDHEPKSPDSGHGSSAKKSGHSPGAPALPLVTIGGKPVISRDEQLAKDISETTPQALKGRGMDQILAHRVSIVPYAHNPVRGHASAPVQVVMFEDLSCLPCMDDVKKVDAVLAKFISQTQLVMVHAPRGKFQDTNLPAFYARIAARQGKFFEFRHALMAMHSNEQTALFDALLKTGLRERDVRGLMMHESRRFYRELDADALLTRTYAISRPPVLFVNGIRLGQGGLKLDKLEDVLHYVTARIERGLEQAP